MSKARKVLDILESLNPKIKNRNLPQLPGIEDSDWNTDRLKPGKDESEDGVFAGDDEVDLIHKYLGDSVVYTTSEDSSDFTNFTKYLKTKFKKKTKLTINGEEYILTEWNKTPVIIIIGYIYVIILPNK